MYKVILGEHIGFIGKVIRFSANKNRVWAIFENSLRVPVSEIISLGED